jgi:FAD/FMN-containing dehydrogenase
MTTTTTTHDRVLPTLEERFSGDVIRPSDPRYGAARALWNAIVDRKPALIACPRTPEDVATAILSARDAGLEIAIRCGGHSLPGHSMSDGGLTIDLSAMNAVEVDPSTASARVGGGALLNDVGEASAPHALTMPFGHISHTGVAGLTLGGGIGWVMRRYGLAVDSLRSAELVTAEGAMVRASEDENPDLFWALRGGGGNFGVVTQFEFDLHPFGPEALAIDGPAPGEQRKEAAAPEELRDRPSPVERTLRVGEALAGGQGRAAGVADRQRVVGLPAGGDRHRLVQQRHSCLGLAAGDPRAAGVAQGGSLEGDIPDSPRQLHRTLRLFLGLLGRRGALRTLDVEPHPGGAIPAPLEQAGPPAQPAVRERGVAGDPVLGREVDRDVGGGIGSAPPLVLGERLRPELERVLLLA